jgi:hypothetical protein
MSSRASGAPTQATKSLKLSMPKLKYLKNASSVRFAQIEMINAARCRLTLGPPGSRRSTGRDQVPGPPRAITSPAM